MRAQIVSPKLGPRFFGQFLFLGLNCILGACAPREDALSSSQPITSGSRTIASRVGALNNEAAYASSSYDVDLGQQGRAPVDNSIRARDIQNQYIVRLSDGVSHSVVTQELAVQPQYVYTSALNGFAGSLTAAQLERLSQDPRVIAIETVQIFRADTTQDMDASGEPWGLDRITQDFLPLNGRYSYDHDGAGVHAYVIDTGISVTHPEFAGRAVRSFDAFGGDGDDRNGHGTHVAGTIGGTTHGVAKRVQLRGVRVFDATGYGTTATVIAGVDWVMRSAVRPAVVNMSLGGPSSPSLTDAVNRLAMSGILPIVSAGNSGSDACDFSPADAARAVTVGATDKRDAQATFSNYGNCVDLYAPGVDIRSSWPGGGLATISGTSMAAPHVTGVAALYKGTYGDADSATLHNWLISQATPRVLRALGPGSPNLLLFQPL